MSQLLNSLVPQYEKLHWQMTTCEQLALSQVLESLSPEHAIEIGTHRGGSLQVLAHHCRQVDSIDIDPSIPEALGGLFSNVTFHTGNSSELLPNILSQAVRANHPVDFVLIDGDHSSEGVRRDINCLLSLRPITKMVVLMHDAFNPDCRAGIVSANWRECPYVHEVEIDFIPGVYHQHAYDSAAARTMWGGFACALLKPDPRQGQLLVSQRQQGLFQAVHLQSSHATSNRTWVQRAKDGLRPWVAGRYR